MIYLDWNAAAPLCWQAKDVIKKICLDDCILNPSSLHGHGRKARKILEDAREEISRKLDFSDHFSCFFTSSGTEANQLAVFSCFEQSRLENKPFHWLTTQVEHDCHRVLVKYILSKGGQVSFFPLEKNGNAHSSGLSLINSSVSLVSMIWANNETGAINDIAFWGNHCKDKGVLFHIDAVQALGKIPFLMSHLPVDYLAVSGAKIGALAGVGALVARKKVPLHPQIFGFQEQRIRGGSHHLVAIATMAAAVGAIDFQKKSTQLQDLFEALLQKLIPDLQINGKPHRLSQTTHLTLLNRKFAQNEMVSHLDLKGFCVSAGSACSAGIGSVSAVLKALGFSDQDCFNSLRVSYSQETTWDELSQFAYSLSVIAK
jgi:cysteine desulfurase